MRNQPPRLNHTTLKRNIRLVFLFLILILCSPSLVWAQEPGPEVVPQIVTLLGETETCGDQVWPFTIEIWNVGTEGGEAYAQAVVSGYDCVNDKFGDILKTFPVGTFSGGPNGILTIEGTDGTLVPWQLVDGKEVKNVADGQVVMIVQNPEAFDGFITAPPPPKDCTAAISLPPDLKPGDDIWVTATYADLEGAPLASDTIISEGWIINGQAGALLTTWDGQAIAIELQYTCPDGTAHSTTYNLPAQPKVTETAPLPTAEDSDVVVQPEEPAPAPPLAAEADEAVQPEEPAPAAPEDTPADSERSPWVPVLIAGALAVGGAGVLGAGAIIYGIVKSTGIVGGKPPKPTGPKPAAQPPGGQQPAVPAEPVSAPPPQPPSTADQPLHFDYPEPLTPQEISNLKNRRAEMEATIEDYKHDWQATYEQLQRLQRTQKKNLIKRMLQLGLETQDIVGVKNPTDLATKILSIPLEEAIGKPSPEKETEILLAMDKLIQNMKGKLGELQGNVKYLRNEIRNIDKKLNK